MNAPATDPRTERATVRTRNRRLRLTIVGVIVAWTFLYNLLIKRQTAGESFFGILDTISDDFVMGTTLTVGVGVGIVLVFSVTKLYTQIIANIHSFRILEELVHGELRRGEWRALWRKILHFEDLERPTTTCPQRVSSLLLAISFIYAMSWVYVLLFSEALFFVSWSAGVNLEIDPENPGFILMALPMLALAIPFSARVMAYVRYPYAQDYADFMPGAVFVLLLVGSLGALFQSDDQKVFLAEVWNEPEYLRLFLRNGVFLAFIPVFFEGAFWLWELNRSDAAAAAPAADGPGPAAE